MSTYAELAEKLGKKKGELEKKLSSLTGEFQNREKEAIQKKISDIDSFMEGELQQDQERSKAESLRKDLLKAKTPQDHARIQKEYGLDQAPAQQGTQYGYKGGIDPYPINDSPMIPFDNPDEYKSFQYPTDNTPIGSFKPYQHSLDQNPANSYYSNGNFNRDLYPNDLYKNVPVQNNGESYPDSQYSNAPQSMPPSGGGYDVRPGTDGRTDRQGFNLGNINLGKLDATNAPNLINAFGQFQNVDYIPYQQNPANQVTQRSMQESVNKARQAREALTMNRYIDPSQRFKQADQMYSRGLKNSQNLTGQEQALYQGAINAQTLDAKNKLSED